jgi:hypothetical protein
MALRTEERSSLEFVLKSLFAGGKFYGFIIAVQKIP